MTETHDSLEGKTTYTITMTDEEIALIRGLAETVLEGQLIDYRGRELHTSNETTNTLKNMLSRLRESLKESPDIKIPNTVWFADIDYIRDSLSKGEGFATLTVHESSRTIVTYKGRITGFKRYVKNDEELYALSLGDHEIDDITEHQLVQIYYNNAGDGTTIIRPRLPQQATING